MTTANEPFTAESTEDVEIEIVVHANGDRTIVPAGLSEDDKQSLSLLSGDELAAAVAEHVAKKDREEAAAKAAEATQAVLADPPAATTASTSAAGLAGPDPVVQGGTSTGGEDGAGAVFPTTVPAPGTGDAETVKVTEAADPTGGTQPVDQGEKHTADPGANTTTGSTATTTLPAPDGSTGPQQGPNI